MARIDSRTCRSKDGAEVTIRTAVEADAAAVLTMATEYIDENAGMVWAPGEYRKTEAETRERLRTMLEDPLKLFLVAELDREIVGNIDFQVGARLRTAHAGEFGMGMLPKVRGRGLGSLLLSHLVEWAVSVPQIEKVKLGVLSNNLRAIGLYEKHGFREEGRLWRDVKYADGSYADLVLMARFV